MVWSAAASNQAHAHTTTLTSTPCSFIESARSVSAMVFEGFKAATAGLMVWSTACTIVARRVSLCTRGACTQLNGLWVDIYPISYALDDASPKTAITCKLPVPWGFLLPSISCSHVSRPLLGLMVYLCKLTKLCVTALLCGWAGRPAQGAVAAFPCTREGELPLDTHIILQQTCINKKQISVAYPSRNVYLVTFHV